VDSYAWAEQKGYVQLLLVPKTREITFKHPKTHRASHIDRKNWNQ